MAADHRAGAAFSHSLWRQRPSAERAGIRSREERDRLFVAGQVGATTTTAAAPTATAATDGTDRHR